MLRKPKAPAATPPVDATAASAAVTPTAILPLHSPLGASSSERWMNCPGSTALAEALGPTSDVDDPEYRRDGVMAHELASACLMQNMDAWELMDGFPLVTPEMSNAVQQYLNYVRSLNLAEMPFKGIHVVDYKHGEGIVVEPEENSQLMYYAFGFLEGKVTPNCGDLYVEKRVHLPEFHPQFYGTVDCALVKLSMPESSGDYHDDEPVRLTIVQPRVPWHPKGVIRSWDTTAGALRKWAYEKLRPAMEYAHLAGGHENGEFTLGDWCRFCPAHLLCPAMKAAAFEAQDEASHVAPADMTQEELAFYWSRRQAVNMFYKTLDERVFRLLNEGKGGPELAAVVKLVPKITYRVWKSGSEKEVVKKLGKDNAYTKPELITPAAAEKLVGGPEVVAEFATTPPATGYTLAPASDRREAVVIKPTEEKFAAFIGAQTKDVDPEKVVW